ncbi:hypothetical protein PR202_ga30214 [Eleusine coracana subsp. coracana]|uniref:Uncharacterized protein n=1 Tax=Eleusine coracana subsp. coracana TaxID=191504 RepID=A0AAV5DNP6_ELECO|nr:hypothetical protein QOZ80_4BG0359990 [Eleusine coracana subsp. coracana]KAK3145357.1 hypothetical protein QOZ80_4AG0327830 [Eleusine coracana subsp. coracana]GJN11974.1 hypothetical protein PR202_ga30214 [Eleusine coracana subsp. coracana]
MAKQYLLVVVLVASVLQATTSTSTSSANSTLAAAATAYDVLEQNNLPRGLLPLGVQSYALHAGGLEVTLPGECNFFVPVAGKQFKFRYGAQVNGVIRSGSITRLSGVRMQVEFAWLGFNEVSRSGDKINILLEKSTQTFPVSSFSQSPRCS